MIFFITFAVFIFSPYKALSSPESLGPITHLHTNSKTTDPGATAYQLEDLEKIISEKSSLEIHNKAIQLLRDNHKVSAILLLKKNTYRNLFLPSYFALLKLKTSLSHIVFFIPVSLLIMTFVCLFFLWMSIKNSSPLRLKGLFSAVVLAFLILFSGLFVKKRVSPLNKIKLRKAPYASAVISSQLEPSADLMVLEETKGWFRIQSFDQQTGWISKNQVFQIF